VPDLRGLSVVGGDYREQDIEPLMLRTGMLDEQVAEWARLSEQRVTLAYPVTIRHSMALRDRFRAAGVEAQHLDGSLPGDERRALVAGLREGTVPVVCSVGVLSEGTNIPRAKCILGVRPTASLAVHTQQGMRCATPFEDIRPRILDTPGNCYRLGLPFEDRRWSFRREENGRPVGAGGGVVRRCDGCGAVAPGGARQCPGCLAAFTVPVPVIPSIPLTLEVVTPAKKQLGEEHQRLLDYARGKGFKKPEVWVVDVLAKKYGVVEGGLDT
jgi:hypothetical protein